MGKRFLPMLIFSLFLATPSAGAVESLQALVIDRDVKGTNVREKPSGKIVDVIPYASPDASDELLEKRVVAITGQSGAWFSVVYAGEKRGWMHRSVIGFCAASSEDGKASLDTAPHSLQEPGKTVVEVPDGARLTLKNIDLKTEPGWAEVEYEQPEGYRVSGWISEQNMSSNVFNGCWR